MKLSEHDIDEILKKTWDDQHLSRGERRALAQLVEEPAEMRLRVRRRSFAVAHEFVETADPAKVLTWLEEVQKALIEPAPPPSASEHRAEAYFSPRDGVCMRIVRALEQVRASADLAVFTITDDRITKAIIAMHQRGVKVRIVSDDDKANDLGSDIERLARAGIALRIDRTPVHMHHKFAVLDGRILLNGSYNWTRSANEENAENILLTEDPELVTAFGREFEHCWGHGQAY